MHKENLFTHFAALQDQISGIYELLESVIADPEHPRQDKLKTLQAKLKESLAALNKLHSVTSEDIDRLEGKLSDLESVIDLIHDGVGVADAEGRIVLLNASHKRITGHKKEDLLGKKLSTLKTKGVISESIALKVFESGKQVTIMQKFKSGKEALVTGKPFYDEDGKIIKVVASFRDLTELIRLRESVRRIQELNEQYRMEVMELRRKQIAYDKVLANSPAMKKVVDRVIRVAGNDCTILITGESGVGKEVVAKMVHNLSLRAEGPFIEVNCGAIPASLLESELFGYETGAFTGASSEGKRGLFELANGGTLLLDEIGELSTDLQVKLLRAIQEQEIYRLGGTKPIKLNFRLIASTNQNLKERINSGNFREDLYYRLNVIPIEIPPLKERKEDIIPLALHFMENIAAQNGKSYELTTEAAAFLEQYHWPGNVRELRNLFERLSVFAESNTIGSTEIMECLDLNTDQNITPLTISGVIPLREAKKMVEGEIIRRALKKYGSARKTADYLGVSHTSLNRKIKEHSLKEE